MSSNGTAREEPSSHDDSPVSKRRRIAFSCLDCRRRKLKCDRLFPSCSRCQKGGHADTCTYDSDAVESALTSGERNRNARDLSAADTGTSRTIPRLPSVARSFAADAGDDNNPKSNGDDTTARLYAQEERIRQLENRIIGLEKVTHGTRSPELIQDGPRSRSDQREAAVEETMIFRGKSFKTQFYGSSHHTSYLSHLPELRLFMKEMMVQLPALAHVQRELRSTKIKGNGQEDGIPINDSALHSFLPQRKIADLLVRIYVENLETTHRVLHLPSFWEEYFKLWNAPQDARPAFVALVLLILATTYCINQEDQSLFRGDSSLGRETAIMWIRACDSWLQAQSQKHTTITVFQIHCLSFIAKQMNSVKRKRTWTSAGNLMRHAMSAGLHRDAEIVNLRHASANNKKISVFDQEMRKRIWATISEMEMQTALDRGMPSMLRDLVSDCGPPLNINDEDFDLSIEELPPSRPLSQYTRSSFQHLSYSSWALRLELASRINGSSPQPQYEDVLLYDRKIMQRLDDIPHWEDQEGQVSQILLQLQLQQLLLYLHRPFARCETQSSRYNYSANVHLRSAMTILDLHNELTSSGNSFLNLFRNDIFGAALSICYNVSISVPDYGYSIPSRCAIVRLGGDAVQYLEKALMMLEGKTMRIGVGLQEYYCVCAIMGLLKKFPSSGQSKNEEKRAAESVTRLIQRVLSLQDNYSAAATLASLPTMPVSAPNGTPTNRNGVPPAAQMESTEFVGDFGQDLEGLDLTNLAGWDLEAFWNF